MNIFAIASGALLAVTLAGAAEARTLTLSHNQPEDHPVHLSMRWMADRVTELTKGELSIDISPNSQLGTQREAVELVQAGALDMAKSNASEMEAFDAIYSVFNVPYVFKDNDHFYRMLTSDAGKQVLQHSRNKGFIGLTYYDSGARSFYANKSITTPADLKGMKVRVQPGPTAIRMMQLLGASATPLPYGELYTALQQRVVDAAENNPTALVTGRHGEVAKVFSLDEHTQIPDVLLISTTTWDDLEAEHQKALQQAADESLLYHKELWAKVTEEAIETAKTQMNVKFVEVDKEAFRKATQPMREEIAKTSKETADLLQKIEEME